MLRNSAAHGAWKGENSVAFHGMDVHDSLLKIINKLLIKYIRNIFQLSNLSENKIPTWKWWKCWMKSWKWRETWKWNENSSTKYWSNWVTTNKLNYKTRVIRRLKQFYKIFWPETLNIFGLFRQIPQQFCDFSKFHWSAFFCSNLPSCMACRRIPCAPEDWKLKDNEE